MTTSVKIQPEDITRFQALKQEGLPFTHQGKQWRILEVKRASGGGAIVVMGVLHNKNPA